MGDLSLVTYPSMEAYLEFHKFFQVKGGDPLASLRPIDDVTHSLTHSTDLMTSPVYPSMEAYLEFHKFFQVKGGDPLASLRPIDDVTHSLTHSTDLMTSPVYPSMEAYLEFHKFFQVKGDDPPTSTSRMTCAIFSAERCAGGGSTLFGQRDFGILPGYWGACVQRGVQRCDV